MRWLWWCCNKKADHDYISYMYDMQFHSIFSITTVCFPLIIWCLHILPTLPGLFILFHVLIFRRSSRIESKNHHGNKINNSIKNEKWVMCKMEKLRLCLIVSLLIAQQWLAAAAAANVCVVLLTMCSTYEFNYHSFFFLSLCVLCFFSCRIQHFFLCVRRELMKK